VRELERGELGAYLVAVEQLNDEDGGKSFWRKNCHRFPILSPFSPGLYLPLKLPQNGRTICSQIEYPESVI